MAIAFMSKLTLAPLSKPGKQSPVMDRRSKILLKLNEQLALAKAHADGTAFAATKKGWGKDEAGKKVRVDLPRKVSPWFFADGDKVVLLVRYGAAPLTLGPKGQKSIVLPGYAALPSVLETVIQAVGAGELDAAITEVVGARKSSTK